MKNPEYLVLGLVFFSLAGYLLKYRFKLLRNISAVVITPTSPIKSLLNLARGQMVEVKGKLVAEKTLLKAPFSNRDCLFYHSVRKDLIEDKALFDHKHRKFRYLTMEDLRSSSEFYIEDQTGKIAVNPQDLKIDGRRVIGSADESILDSNSSLLDKVFTPGHNAPESVREEQILIPGIKVYAIAWLFNGKQGPFIGTPLDKSLTAFISVKTEEALIEESRQQLRIYSICIFVTTTIGIVCTLISR